MFIKSPLNYTGGKFKLLSSIFEIMPPHINTFVDLFAGGFNVGINANAETIVCNDQLSYVIDLYQYLQKQDITTTITLINKRIAELNLSQTNKEGYLKLRNLYNKQKNILDLFILMCFSFNHQIRFNNQHQFNAPFGKDRSSYNGSIQTNLINFCTALQEKNIKFSAKDFQEVDLGKLTKNDLVYCDPPYLISTGTYNDGNRGFKNWTTKEEQILLTLLDKLNKQGVKFVLSNVLYHKNQENTLLINWSKQYNIHFLNKTYNNCNYQLKEKQSKTVEVLVTNFSDSFGLLNNL